MTSVSQHLMLTPPLTCQSCITSIADSCQSLMPMTTDPVTMHQKKQRAFICSTGIFVSSRNMWNDLITACSALLQPKQSSLCLLCLNIILCNHFILLAQLYRPSEILQGAFLHSDFQTFLLGWQEQSWRHLWRKPFFLWKLFNYTLDR